MNLKDMGKSDEYIAYDAYVGYLRKVTGAPSDPDSLRESILIRSVENSELQTALIILKRLAVAVCIVLICALCAGGVGLFSSSPVEDGNLWNEARIEGRGTMGAMRLYEAYEHSMKNRENI